MKKYNETVLAQDTTSITPEVAANIHRVTGFSVEMLSGTMEHLYNTDDRFREIAAQMDDAMANAMGALIAALFVESVDKFDLAALAMRYSHATFDIKGMDLNDMPKKIVRRLVEVHGCKPVAIMRMNETMF